MSGSNHLSLKKQFTVIIGMILAFGGLLTLLVFGLSSKLDSSQEDLRASKIIAIDAATIKGSISETGDALKSLLIDPTNEMEKLRKREVDQKLIAQFDEMDKHAHGSPLEEPLKKLRTFVLENLKSQEDQIIADLMAKKKDDAEFKYTINYFPVRRTFEKDADAFAEAAIKFDEERAAEINRGMKTLSRVLLALQFVGILALVIVLWRMIQSIMARMQELSRKLELASVEIRGRSTGQLEAASELSRQIEEAATSLRSTASAAQEVNRAVDFNVGLAETSKRLSAKGRGNAERGQNSVQSMIGAITDVSGINQKFISELEDSFKDLEGIRNVIENIEAKTSAINQIVLQTRLLSFNASVEASRAGVHGKGFAVVAEEVGKLANMSRESSLEIEELIRESIGQVERTISGIRGRLNDITRLSIEKIGAGTRAAEECRGIFQSIFDDVSEIDSKITDIFASSKEQAKGVREIAVSVQQADDAIAKNSEQARSGAEETNEIMNRALQLDAAVSDIAVVIFGKTNHVA